MRSGCIITILLVVYSYIITRANCERSNENIEFIKSMVSDKDIFNFILDRDYVFYFTGHHGYMWSIVVSDSLGYHFFNGTTRQYMERNEPEPFDTMAFIKNNHMTLKYAFDGLSTATQHIELGMEYEYAPIFNELYAVRNNEIIFCLYNSDKYISTDSTTYWYNLQKLIYLMNWIASPSLRQYLSMPKDGL